MLICARPGHEMREDVRNKSGASDWLGKLEPVLFQLAIPMGGLAPLASLIVL